MKLSSAFNSGLPSERLQCYVPLEALTYDPFGPLPGYSPEDAPWGGPIWSRLRSSIYPVLDLCVDAYYVSISRTFQGDIEFVHHLDAVRQFLREGADVEVSDDASGGTCLHFAAGSGCLELCKILLRSRARAAAQDRQLQTPIWWAMAGNHAGVCRLLLDHDMHVAKLANLGRMTPLHGAASLGREDIVQMLLHYYRPRGPDVLGRELRTPLHLAARKCHYSVCVMLVEAAADPQAACSHGKTALHYAAECGVAGLELCHYLAQQRPLAKRLRDALGQTPVEVAARCGPLVPEMRTVLKSPLGARPSMRFRPRCRSSSAVRAAALPCRCSGRC